jgi:carbonic anhydrase/acetyltransferase-like protein (isoleucine patch superfamily)
MTPEERLNTFLGRDPTIDPTAYIAPEATVIGDVRMGPRSSIWPGAVARGDINYIEIGEASNVQDGTIVHLADDFPVVIGKHVTIGHAAIIHACVIEDECLIGMGATILDGAVIGHHSIIGANALVTQNTIIPPGSMALGTPAKVVKTLTEEQQAGIKKWAEKYVLVSAAHRKKLGIQN